MNRAHQLDPLSAVISVSISEIHMHARQYDEAIADCKKVADENPAYADVHKCLAFAYWAKRMYPQVIAEWRVFGQLSSDRKESEFASSLEKGLRSGGWKDALAKGIETRLAQRKTEYISAYDIACLYADLGNKDEAFRWLNIAYQEHSPDMEGLKTDFLLDPLQSDPRLAELVRKVGLPQ